MYTKYHKIRLSFRRVSQGTTSDTVIERNVVHNAAGSFMKDPVAVTWLRDPLAGYIHI